MSYKRSRSPSGGGNNYSRNVRGREECYRSGRDFGGGESDGRGSWSRGRPSSGHHGGNEERWDRRGHRGDRRSMPDFSSHFAYDNLSGRGEMRHGQGWALNTDSWNGRYRSEQQEFVPNPLYNRNSDSDWRRNGDGRHRNGDGGYSRGSQRGRHSEPHPRSAEQRRVEVSGRRDVSFLEEAALPPAFAFRLDSSSNPDLLRTESAGQDTPSFFPSFYRDNVLGATEDYIKRNNIRSYLNKSHTQEEEVKEEESPPPPPGTEPLRTPSKIVQFMSIQRKGTPKETEEGTTADKREDFNRRTRNNPEDVELWRDFVKFQDEDCVDLKRKGRVEKKVAILEKALRSNPKSTDLHFDRLDLLSEIVKSGDVVGEWEKLVGANEDSEPVWIERFKFSATQLELSSCSGLGTEFGKGFEKLRRMLSPSYPAAHPKPSQIHLLVPDLLYGLTVLLRNLGYTEKSVAICQAQLEFHFNFPEEGRRLGSDKSGWKGVVKLFELFWGLETLRFGEPGCGGGWKEVLETESPESLGRKVDPIGVPDSVVQDFESGFFEAIESLEGESVLTRSEWTLAQSAKWALIESLRSKVYWTPWRGTTSDIPDCDDTNRIISSQDVTPFLVQIPSTLSLFQSGSAYFRYVLNYLLLLAPHYLPKTHTLESILAPFSSLSLSDTSTFWTEVNYWRKGTEFYHTNPKTTHLPEGFQLPEYSLPSAPSIFPTGKKLKVGTPLPDSVSKRQEELLEENATKLHGMIRSIVTQSLDHLQPNFASLLVQTLIRFEQRSLGGKDPKEPLTFSKNLLQNPKVRDCVEGYLEIGLLEYFGGKKKRAVALLIKTVVSSAKVLRQNVHEENVGQFVEQNWEKVAGVTKLFRVLAEFHLKESRADALGILTSLGNHFDTSFLESKDGSEATSNVAILRAKKFFESVLDRLVGKEEDVVGIDCDDWWGTEFGKWDGGHCLEYFGQKTNLIVEWTVAYSLFAYLVHDSLDAASEVMTRVMDKLEQLPPLSRTNKYSSSIVNGHRIREELFVSWSRLGALHVTLHPMQNAKLRSILGKALELYPSSPPLLLLYMNVESQCSVVGKLWRSLVKTVKERNASDFCTLDWTPVFMAYTLSTQMEEIEEESAVALHEFGIGGPAVPPDTIFYKVDGILSGAEKNVLSGHCPLIWRLHLKHLAMRAKEGKDMRRAEGLLYEAIRQCPTSKCLYLDGILYFPHLMHQVLDLMSQNELLIRMPLEELHLLSKFKGKEDEEVAVVDTLKSKSKGRKNLKKKKKGVTKRGSEEDLVPVEIVSD